MHIDQFKARIVTADDAEIDELCIAWLYDFAWDCDKKNIALMLEVVADNLGIDVQQKELT